MTEDQKYTRAHVLALATELEKSWATVARVVELHGRKFSHDGDSTMGRPYCHQCDVPAPCPTMLAIEGEK